jgi:serine/threonine-protein kinase RsbW
MARGHVLTFPATRAGFERAFINFRRALDGHPLERAARYNCELVFEEIVTNIIKHGSRDSREPMVEVSLDFANESVVLRFEDDGIPFDPRHHASPEPLTSLENAMGGGRGLLLVRKAARGMDYERTAHQRNRLTVTIAGQG